MGCPDCGMLLCAVNRREHEIADLQRENARLQKLLEMSKRCEEALRNMVGYFGCADVELQMGKRYSETHREVVVQAKGVVSELDSQNS